MWTSFLAKTSAWARAAKKRKTRDSIERSVKKRARSASSCGRMGRTASVEPSRSTMVASRWAGYVEVTESACYEAAIAAVAPCAVVRIRPPAGDFALRLRKRRCVSLWPGLQDLQAATKRPRSQETAARE